MTTLTSQESSCFSHPASASRVSRRCFLSGAAAAGAAAMLPRAWGASSLSGDELIFSSVMNMSRAIRRKKVSAVELVQTQLNRIATVNPQINAVVTLCADRAIEEARQADKELARGKVRGVLHGVPMTIKDSLDTAGIVSTAGTIGRKSFVAKHDATVVQRLRAAGAILLGKTNTPEFTMSYDTQNLLFGATRNPYDVTKSPGGSSGGAAAAIAAGATAFDIGSDTGGSIRVPSCFCGIAGIKPTTGRMPLTGHVICTGQGLMDPLTQVGPMSRFVDDLFPLLKITAGPDGKDPAVIPMPLRQPFWVTMKDLRVAFHTDNGIVPATDEVANVVRMAASSISDVGAQVTESCPKALAPIAEIWNHPYVADGGQWVKHRLEESGTQHWDPNIDWFWQFPSLSGEQLADMLRSWNRFRVEMMSWMNHFDVLISPANARASWSTGFTRNGEDMRAFIYTAAYNMTGWPAAVVRCGTSHDEMPIGVQVVAPPWREDVCLAVAKHLEAALGGWQRPQI